MRHLFTADPSQHDVPQAFSTCCQGLLHQSGRTIGLDQQQGWMWGGRNAQTATQIPRQADMMMHLAGPGHEFLGAGN